ncbi:hypothetical protein pb186bvf_017079 [Paramecium bursaria]
MQMLQLVEEKLTSSKIFYYRKLKIFQDQMYYIILFHNLSQFRLTSQRYLIFILSNF